MPIITHNLFVKTSQIKFGNSNRDNHSTNSKKSKALINLDQTKLKVPILEEGADKNYMKNNQQISAKFPNLEIV